LIKGNKILRASQNGGKKHSRWSEGVWGTKQVIITDVLTSRKEGEGRDFEGEARFSGRERNLGRGGPDYGGEEPRLWVFNEKKGRW